jgi:hypothetical protein
VTRRMSPTCKSLNFFLTWHTGMPLCKVGQISKFLRKPTMRSTIDIHSIHSSHVLI